MFTQTFANLGDKFTQTFVCLAENCVMFTYTFANFAESLRLLYANFYLAERSRKVYAKYYPGVQKSA